MSRENYNGNNKDVNIKINIDGEEHEVNWSEGQASNAGFHSVFENAEFPLSNIIASVLKNNLPLKVDTKSNPRCPHCGLTFLELLEVGRMGCANCYAAFGENIEALLERIHGSAVHTGIVPSQSDKQKPVKKNAKTKTKTRAKKQTPKLSRTEKLKLEMKKAIEAEDYENAARLRDKLKEMEVAGK